jgi:hypothetical protein
MAMVNPLRNYVKRNATLSYWFQQIEIAMHKKKFTPQNHLRAITNEKLIYWLCKEEVYSLYQEASIAFNKNRGATSGGASIGDTYTLFSLIYHLSPRNVAEIGTHNGISTFFIAWALELTQKKKQLTPSLDTVDIVDVNHPVSGFWNKQKDGISPASRLRAANIQTPVNFYSCGSHNFFSTEDKIFDFIFIDGSHRATHVYQDTINALKNCSTDAIIVLHDYYVGGKHNFREKFPLPGVFLGVRALEKKMSDLSVMPLAELPVEVNDLKYQTSLVVLCKK